MRSQHAPNEPQTQELLSQIARLLAAGVLRLRKGGAGLAELSRPGAEVEFTQKSGDKGLAFSNETRLSVSTG